MYPIQIVVVITIFQGVKNKIYELLIKTFGQRINREPPIEIKLIFGEFVLLDEF